LDTSQLWIKASFGSKPALDTSQLWIQANVGSKPTLDPSPLWFQANFDPSQWIQANIRSQATLDPSQLWIQANFGSISTLDPRKLGPRRWQHERAEALKEGKGEKTASVRQAGNVYFFSAFNQCIGS
jgi:hypothetical protein